MEEQEPKNKDLKYQVWIFPTAILVFALYLLLYYTPSLKSNGEDSYMIKKEADYIREVDSLISISQKIDTFYIEELRKNKKRNKKNSEQLIQNLKLPVDSVRYWNNILLINTLGKKRWGKE